MQIKQGSGGVEHTAHIARLDGECLDMIEPFWVHPVVNVATEVGGSEGIQCDKPIRVVFPQWGRVVQRSQSARLFRFPFHLSMASPLAAAIPQATTSGDLADLLAVSSPAKVHPADDAILAVLTPRFRADLPYARIGSTALVVVNPCKALANVNDASAKEYEERCYKDTRLGLADSRRPPQPHLYEQAAKIYLLMRRRLESQAVVAR